MVILTDKERKIIEKKILNKKLTQSEKNRLSRAIRPKLKEMLGTDAKTMLERIDYNPSIIAIENRIIKEIRGSVLELDSIVLYGSAVQTNYHSYRDIDIMIVTKSKIYSSEIEKYRKIKEIKDALESSSIIADIEIISRDNLVESYKNNPTLIYELKDCKVIFGDLTLPRHIEIYRIDLQMKLDWSDIPTTRPNGSEVYSALRNTILVRLILNKIIDNSELNRSLYDELGKNLIERLKNNQQTPIELEYARDFLKRLVEDTRKRLRGDLWEKIEL